MCVYLCVCVNNIETTTIVIVFVSFFIPPDVLGRYFLISFSILLCLFSSTPLYGWITNYLIHLLLLDI